MEKIFITRFKKLLLIIFITWIININIFNNFVNASSYFISNNSINIESKEDNLILVQTVNLFS